jgi:hypothetical protein
MCLSKPKIPAPPKPLKTAETAEIRTLSPAQRMGMLASRADVRFGAPSATQQRLV